MRSDESKGRYTIPDDWPYQDARELFLKPDVRPADDPLCEFKWEKPDVEGLVGFLVGEKQFSEERVRAAAQRLDKGVKSQQQARIEGFFKVKPKTEEEKAASKRKAEEQNEERKKKAKEDKKEKAKSKKPRAVG